MSWRYSLQLALLKVYLLGICLKKQMETETDNCT